MPNGPAWLWAFAYALATLAPHFERLVILMRMRGRPIAKALFYNAMRFLGRDDVLAGRAKRPDALLVLNLHRVSPERNPFWNPLHPDIFDDLLGFLKRHFYFTTFGALGSAPRDQSPAILSFDDGYADFAEFAIPILEHHGIAANQNVIPSAIESGIPPWESRLFDFLNAAPRSLVNESLPPGFQTRLESDDWDNRLQFGLRVSDYLKHRLRNERETLLAESFDRGMLRMGPFPLTRMLTRDQIRRAAGVHEFGAHSWAHDSMGEETLDHFSKDFSACQSYFRDHLQLPLSIYAFPNGSHRPEQVAALQNAGISRILLVEERLARRQDRVCPRITVYGDSAAEARFVALGCRGRI